MAQGPGSGSADHPFAGHSLGPVPEKAQEGHFAEDLDEYFRTSKADGDRRAM